MNKTAHGAVAVLLLCCSNAFMNAAWYLHLKFKSWPMVQAIFISWGIALFEYMLQVPANRIGHFSSGGPFTAPQLKTIQEALSLSTFAIFSVTVLKEKLRWSDYLAFGLIFSGVVVGMALKPKAADSADVALLPPPPVAPAPEPVPGAPDGSAAAGPAAGKAVPGRRLLELLPRRWRGGTTSSAGARQETAAAGSDPEEQHLAGGQGGSSEQELLPARDALYAHGSAAVLLSDAEVHASASSSQQRERTRSGGGEHGAAGIAP